jgi:hypothetical protein
MNERIKLLAEQAEEWNDDGDKCEVNLEKFAELIVRECARVARATLCPYEENEVRQRLGHTWDMASIQSGREIVKHFGVEL